MLHENLALLAVRNTRRGNPCNYFCSDTVLDKTAISGFDNCRFFPLYLYTDTLGKLEKTPNLDKQIWSRINEAAGGIDSTPIQVFNYIYAVLHTPEYRERYKEFLKVDFPRIPYPKSGDVFMKLAAIGEKLIAVHLLKDPVTQMMFDQHAKFPISGTSRVDALKFDNGKVWINREQYFDNVPETAWTFFIGGYQPAQKWLKDRKGRTLSADDVMHYKSIIIALLETSRLMGELSALSSEWLPSIAFSSGLTETSKEVL